MKYIISILFLMAAVAVVAVSCSKYKDKKGPAFTAANGDTTHYCNDATAANDNWGFPGIPDNTVCIYPADLYVGKYVFHDSVSLQSTGLPIFVDTFILTFHKINNSRLAVTGFCANGDSLFITAAPTFLASVDTTEGDSVTNWGQSLCGVADTINGSFVKDRVFDSLMYLSLQVASDTGVVTLHIGTAKKIQ